VIELRHYCRNPRCRMKLAAPVENEHHAFCCRGCHSSFYRSRCLVCEDPMRRKREGQKLASGHKLCEREYRRFPHVYALPVPAYLISDESVGRAHSTGIQTGDIGERPRHRCLRGWSWRSGDCEHDLRDVAGTLLARIESNAGRHRLTYPRMTPAVDRHGWNDRRAVPILSWPDLGRAKHRAESFALSALPLDPATAARVNRDNATPHPMGPPLNRQDTPVAFVSNWRPSGSGTDMPDVPAFLRRLSSIVQAEQEVA
jgi:hypothetical protein